MKSRPARRFPTSRARKLPRFANRNRDRGQFSGLCRKARLRKEEHQLYLYPETAQGAQRRYDARNNLGIQAQSKGKRVWRNHHRIRVGNHFRNYVRDAQARGQQKGHQRKSARQSSQIFPSDTIRNFSFFLDVTLKNEVEGGTQAYVNAVKGALRRNSTRNICKRISTPICARNATSLYRLCRLPSRT